MADKSNPSWARLFEALEDGLSEANYLGLEVVAARLSAIIEHLRELEISS